MGVAWWKVPLFIVAPLVAGCGQEGLEARNSSCRDFLCNLLTIEREPAMSEGSLTWDDTPFPLQEGGDPKILPPSGSCNAGIGYTSTYTRLISTLPEFEQRAAARCRSGDRELSFYMRLDDLRVRGAEPQPLKVEGGEVRSSSCVYCGGGCAFEATGTVTIEEAEGGPAPFPAMVTPDYRRVVRVELTSDEASCAKVSATLRFTSRTADVHGKPAQVCRDCVN